MLTMNVTKTSTGDNALTFNVDGKRVTLTGNAALIECIAANFQARSGRSLEEILTGDCTRDRRGNLVLEHVNGSTNNATKALPVLPTPTMEF